MKLTKENVYISLIGKSEEELTELYWLLANNNEVLYRSFQRFLEYPVGRDPYLGFCESSKYWWSGIDLGTRKEVTIDQLKEILQPKGTFTPIAMRCTQEQFEAIKPKLEGLKIEDIRSFSQCNYLANNLGGNRKLISNVTLSAKADYAREVYEEWNEEIFLKACGIETETLQQQLEKAEAEVKRLKEAIETSKIKEGEWCKFWNYDKSKFIIAKYQGNKFACITTGVYFIDCEKITDSDLLESLNF